MQRFCLNIKMLWVWIQNIRSYVKFNLSRQKTWWCLLHHLEIILQKISINPNTSKLHTYISNLHPNNIYLAIFLRHILNYNSQFKSGYQQFHCPVIFFYKQNIISHFKSGYLLELRIYYGNYVGLAQISGRGS